MRLRGYQEELVKRCEGGNYIIVAPTGSGKTAIAATIIKQQLKKGSKKRIVFLVPTVPLVQQQGKVLEDILTSTYRVGKFHGDKYSQGQWESVVSKNEILVLTAQLLVNEMESAIQNPSLFRNPMDDIQLIIFDECHHCKKKHPYGVLMKKYYKPMNQSGHEVPRIIGLTASPASKKTVGETVLDLFRLCLEMQCLVVEVEDNKEELKSYMNNISMKNITVPMLPETYQVQEILFSYLYTLSDIPKADNLGICKFISRVHEALLINDDRHPRAAWQYIVDCIENELDEDTIQKLQELKISKNLFDVETLPNTNQKQYKLLELLAKYESDKDFKAQIFVKTIVGAEELMSFLKHYELPFIRPTYLVGHEEMTARQQLDLVSDFKGENSNVLITTSVGEEGLDTPSCKLVVRMNEMYNAKQLIQSRGRARSKESEFISLFHDESKHIKKSLCCTIEEVKMHESIKIVNNEKIVKALKDANKIKGDNPHQQLMKQCFKDVWNLDFNTSWENYLGYSEQQEYYEKKLQTMEPIQILTNIFKQLFNTEPEYEYTSHNMCFRASLKLPGFTLELPKGKYHQNKKNAKLEIANLALQQFRKKDLLVLPSEKQTYGLKKISSLQSFESLSSTPSSPMSPTSSTSSTYSAYHPTNLVSSPMKLNCPEIIPVGAARKALVGEEYKLENSINILEHLSQVLRIPVKYETRSVANGFECEVSFAGETCTSVGCRSKIIAKKYAAFHLIKKSDKIKSHSLPKGMIKK